jgi:hypothetical protein
MQNFQARLLFGQILNLVGFAAIINPSRDCFQDSQCSMKRRSFEVHLLSMPVPNKLPILSRMQVPMTNKVSHLLVYSSQDSMDLLSVPESS